jgi:hypothetical protein
VSAKSSRRARAVAFSEAQRLALWAKGEAEAFRGLKGIFRRLFKRSRWHDLVGRWYKSNLKRFAKEAARYLRSGQDAIDYADRRRFARAQRKAAIKRRKEKLDAQP